MIWGWKSNGRYTKFTSRLINYKCRRGIIQREKERRLLSHKIRARVSEKGWDWSEWGMKHTFRWTGWSQGESVELYDLRIILRTLSILMWKYIFLEKNNEHWINKKVFCISRRLVFPFYSHLESERQRLVYSTATWGHENLQTKTIEFWEEWIFGDMWTNGRV